MVHTRRPARRPPLPQVGSEPASGRLSPELKRLVAQGLTAMQAGIKVEDASREIPDDARDPELKQALEKGSGCQTLIQPVRSG